MDGKPRLGRAMSNKVRVVRGNGSEDESGVDIIIRSIVQPKGIRHSNE
jgi:hypothetical protein